MSGRQQTGHAWEDVAAQYLERHGLEVLERRYRCRLGELDLVCRDQETLVIVEVRARSGIALTSALESVDNTKQRRIIQATRHLLMRMPRWREQPLRFDVVAVDDIDTAAPRFSWVKNAFEVG